MSDTIQLRQGCVEDTASLDGVALVNHDRTRYQLDQLELNWHDDAESQPC